MNKILALVVLGLTLISSSLSAQVQPGFGTRAGDIQYWNGSAWVALPGNNSGTNVLTENSAGVPSWTAGGALPMFSGRLTLQSGVPVMITSQSAKNVIYYSCYTGTNATLVVTYFSGVSDLSDMVGSCEVSTTLQSSSAGVINTGDVFDVWWVHSGANRICVATNGSGGGWASDTGGSVTARGTGYSQLDRSTRGYLTNKNVIAHCYNGATDYGSVSANQATYLGTFASTAAGQTSFTYGGSGSGGVAAQLFLCNYYNRVSTLTTVTDTQVQYTYSSATVRQAAGSAGNQIAFVNCAQEDAVIGSYNQQLNTAAAVGAAGTVGCGFDTTTLLSTKVISVSTAASGVKLSITTPCQWFPTVGIHTLSANEGSDGSNANGFNNTPGLLQASIRM